MLDLIGNDRPAGDVLSRVVRLSLAGTEYALPVLTIGGNRRWQRQLDARLAGIMSALEAGGDDIGRVFAALNTQVDDLLTLLISYECTPRSEGQPCEHTVHVLPDRQVLEDTIYEDELVAACQEVWRAANPLVATTVDALTRMGVAALSDSSEPMSSPPPNTAGRRPRSKRN